MIDAVAGRRDLLAAVAATALLGGCRRRPHDPRDLVVGSSPTGVPFSFVDPWTNRLTGSMVDSATLVAREAGLRPGFAITPFAALIPSLTAGKIDMIAAAMLRTPARERIVAFSRPVSFYSGALVVAAGDRRAYPGLAALRGHTVGAQIGTRFVDQLGAAGIDRIATYDGLGDLLRDLGNGRIDAAYGDAPIIDYQLRVGPRRAVRRVAEFVSPEQEALCFVMRKGDRRIAAIDRAIDRLKATRIAAVNRRWGVA